MSVLTQKGEIGFALQGAKYGDGTVPAYKAKGQVVFDTNAADGDTVTLGSVTYRLINKLRGIVSVDTNPSNNDTVTIGATTYTFKSSLTPSANEVLIGTDAPTSAANLSAAINAGAGSGTTYGTGTTANASATATVTSNVVNLKAIATGLSAITLSKSSTHITVTAFQLQVNDVFIGSSIAITASNLFAAISAGTGAGTAYGTGTTSNAVAVAAAENDTVFLTAASAGIAGNSTTFSKSSSHITLTTFSGGEDAGAFDPTSLTWFRHRASDIDYDAAQTQGALPLEIGNQNIGPSGWYKAGVFMAGGFSTIPRMENSLGDLLLATFGACSTSTDSPESGVNTHVFKFDSVNPEYIPWMALRKHIPGDAVVRHKGVIGYDNKVANLRLNVSAASPVEARIDFLGRVPSYDNYPESWLYQNSFEDFPSIALGCKGDFKLPTVFANSLPVTNVIVEISNNLTTPQQEMIIGSYFMDDIAVRTRILTVRFVYKWYDPELYERAHGNAANITSWSPSPFETDTSGSDYAFELKVQSTVNIGSTSTPYTMTARANRMIWQPVGALRLQAGNIIVQEYMGTALVPSDGVSDYGEVVLINAQTGYSVPALP